MDNEKQDANDRDSEKSGTVLPDWVQKTLKKSRLGFHRVHDELKRMYDDRIQRVTDIDNKTSPKLEVSNVVSSRYAVFGKLVNFVSSAKCSLTRTLSKSRLSPTPSNGNKRNLYSRTISSNATERNQERNAERKDHRQMPTGSQQSNRMPHEDLLKSNVYNNDRVVAETIMEDSMEGERESQLLYAEIEENEMTVTNVNASKRIDTRLASPAQSKKYPGKVRSLPTIENQHVRKKLMSTTDVELDENYVRMEHSNSMPLSKETSKFIYDSDDASKSSDDEKVVDANHYFNSEKSKSLPCVFSNMSESRKRAFKSRVRTLNVVSTCKSSKTNSKNKSGKNGKKIENLKNDMQVCKQQNIKAEKENADSSWTFYDYTVEEVAECFKNCAFIRLSQVCLDEQLDGEYFRDITEDDLVREPFEMNWFHISKLFKVINGWRPKNR
ncbi:hypothetical protein ACF0H5_000898 [Mactra antiquata]